MRVIPSVVLLAVIACGGPLDRKRLHAAVDELASTASELRMLGDQTRGGPAAYARGQRDDLARRARDALAQLGEGVRDATLDRHRRSAIAAGERVVAAAESEPPGDGGRALDELARRLGGLAEELAP